MAVGGRNATRRSRIVAAAALSAAAVTVVTAAITASGFAVDHVAANDGAVWVTDNAQGDFGRFDYPIAELDAAFGPPGQLQSAYDLDVLQNGTTVLAIDRARADLYAVDVEAGTVVTRESPFPAERRLRSPWADRSRRCWTRPRGRSGPPWSDRVPTHHCPVSPPRARRW